MKTIWVCVAVCCLALLPRPGASAPAPAGCPLDGLVGYWPFDEGKGDRAANLMGENSNIFGNTGDAAAPDLDWTTGRFGGALHFAGGGVRFPRAGQGLAVQQLRELECPQAVTVAAWVKLDETQQSGFIWNREQGYRLALVGQRHVSLMLNLDGHWANDTVSVLTSRSALQPGRWYYVAGVYDGHERRIYLDGQLDARTPATGAISVGGYMSIGENFFGMIDEARVWNRALSQEELARSMAAGAAQVRAALRPSDALRFYPVSCVGLLNNPESAEVAVFNSAPVAFSAGVSVAVLSAGGKSLAEETRQLSISPRSTVHLRLAFQAGEPGMHALAVKAEGRELFRMPVYVMAPHPRQAPGELKLERVAGVDLAQELGPEQLCEDGSSKVVDSPLGRYREGGAEKGARFVARLTLRRPGLHLLRVRYPDDKARTCEVVACSPRGDSNSNVQTGYLTGIAYPITNRMQTLDCVLWARDINQAVIFTTWEAGKPAAATSIEAFEVTGGLPSSPAAASPGARQIGLYWEDAQTLPWCVGAEGIGYEAFDRAACNLCDLMDYTGENVIFHPAVWYDGPIYDSLVEEHGAIPGNRWHEVAGWMDILLKRFEERGFKLYSTFNIHQLPSLAASGNADAEKVKAGEPTINAVTKDGRVMRRTNHGQPPAYNAIHPKVKGLILALVQEMADRYAASPAFGGIAFHLTRCQPTQFGGLDSGYDDWTISKFEKDTGNKIPVDAKDPERFGKRYDWLLANAREPWIQWRCAQLADYYGQAARILTEKRADLKLVAVLLNPHPASEPESPPPPMRKRWEQGTRLVEFSREAGLDPALIGRLPGVVMMNKLGPADYRWCVATADRRPNAEQAMLPVRKMDFTDDQLRDYRTSKEFGVWLYNRYFETARPRNFLRCDWYRDPGWIASAVVPSGDYFMEDYAQALAALDTTLLVNGGFTLGTAGHEAQVERFARVFRLLPVGAWKEVPGLGDHLMGRTLQVGGKRYIYVVNRSAAELLVTIPAASAGGTMRPIGGSPYLSAAESGRTVKLGPYELAAWAAEAAGEHVK
jgi:hypothetical protein